MGNCCRMRELWRGHIWEEKIISVVLSFIHSSVQSLHCVQLQPHEPQHARPACPSPTPGVYSNSCPSSQWCHPAISSCHPLLLLPSIFPSIGVFSLSQFFTWGCQSIWVSALASVLPMNTQDRSALEWTGWISITQQNSSNEILYSALIIYEL